MAEIRVETTIESDGELHLRELPCRKGDRVLAIVTISFSADDGEKDAARQQFLNIARASEFRSSTVYPTRDQLHERD